MVRKRNELSGGKSEGELTPQEAMILSRLEHRIDAALDQHGTAEGVFEFDFYTPGDATPNVLAGLNQLYGGPDGWTIREVQTMRNGHYYKILEFTPNK